MVLRTEEINRIITIVTDEDLLSITGIGKVKVKGRSKVREKG
jgi:hypothetical protein